MQCTKRVQDLFLTGISLTYIFAFYSLYTQITGLYGRNGIIPVANVVEKHVKTAETKFKSTSAETLFSQVPTLIYFFPYSPENSMEIFCITGTIFGILSSIFKSWRNSIVYLSMYLLYLSVFKVGSSFLWFQWDTLLLETGFLCVLLAPTLPNTNNKRHHAIVPWFLVKWLMFRLMFSSGIVKLTSGCPTWWKLNALNYHYESQCLPTWLAWYAHQLPSTIQKLSVIMTYVIEIGLPFFFFAPIRSWRILSGYAQIFLMFAIILTGNYNFFNFLTILLSLPMFDDYHFDFITKKIFGQKKNVNHYSNESDLKEDTLWSHKTFANSCATVGFAILFKRLFTSNKSLILNFTMDDLNWFLEKSIYIITWVAAISFIYTLINAVYCQLCENEASLPKKVGHITKCFIMLPVCVFLFSISMVPFFQLQPSHEYNKLHSVLQEWHQYQSNFELCHSYGLFRRMTGVGGRPELVVEGSFNVDGPWKTYQFKYKPGKLDTKPKWAAPHQPRLDWQMWFAALGSYQHNPWFVSMLHRMLIGQKEVLDLLEHNPFKEKPPTFVRAVLYKYHYTLLNNTSNRWWYREKQLDYVSPLSVGSEQLDHFLDYHGLKPLGEKKSIQEKSVVVDLLNMTRTFLLSYSTPLLLWMVTVSILLIRCLQFLY